MTDPPALDGWPTDDGAPTDDDGAAFAIAEVPAPWGPIQVAATPSAVIGLAVLSPPQPFIDDVQQRTGRARGRAAGNALLETAVAAVEAFLDGRPEAIRTLPIDLATSGAWDRAVLRGVRSVGWGEVTSYGRLARAIGRPGAARAVGGAVGRNPIGLVIPCHRVIAGDGSIGGYGGDWFGSRETLLDIKRELLDREGIRLPIRSFVG